LSETIDVKEAFCNNCSEWVKYLVVDTELNVIRSIDKPIARNVEHHSTAEVVEFYCKKCKTQLARFKGSEVKEFKLV